MLETLTISKFQPHGLLRIELGPTITSIVGPTDAGKSSILRALWWNMTNEPKGDAFIKDGEKDVLVCLNFEGHQVDRYRSASENIYRLDGQEFKAFGNDVPPDVAAALNVGPINFQGQHDAPFWFSETAGEVSRQLNQIVDLGAIDSALSAIDSTIRKARSAVEVISERRDELKEKGKGLRWIKKADEQMCQVETLYDSHVAKAADKTRLEMLIQQVEKYDEKSTSLTRAYKDLTKVRDLGETWESCATRTADLKGKVKGLTGLAALANQSVPPSLATLEAKAHECRDKTIRKRALAVLITQLQEGDLSICQRRSELSNAKSELKKAMGDRCPLCGSKIRTR